MNTTRTFRFRWATVLILCVVCAGMGLSLAGDFSIPSPGSKPAQEAWKKVLKGGDGSSPWPVARILPGVPARPNGGWDAFHLGDLALVAWSENDGKDREVILVVTPASATPQRFQLTHNASPDTDPAFTRSVDGHMALVWLRSNRGGRALAGSLLNPDTGEPGPEQVLMRLDSSIVDVSAALLPGQKFLFAKTIRRGAHFSLEAGDPVSGFVPLIQVQAWSGFGCWLASGPAGETYLVWAQDETSVGFFTRESDGQWRGPEYVPLD